MDTEKFRNMRIVAVKQRVQVVVIYHELDEQENAHEKEWVTESVDRNLPIPYDQ